MRTLVLLLGLTAACGGSGPPSPASPSTEAPPAAASPPASDAVLATALVEQYEQGKAVYRTHRCDTCHEADGRGNPKNPPVIGLENGAFAKTAPAISKLRKGITFTTAADVVAFVHAKMPIDKPGELSEADAYAVTAWMLDESKIALTRPLDAATAPTIKLRAE